MPESKRSLLPVGGDISPARAWRAIPSTVLAALSRITLGLHYINDVLVGGLIGTLITAMSLYIASLYLL